MAGDGDQETVQHAGLGGAAERAMGGVGAAEVLREVMPGEF